MPERSTRGLDHWPSRSIRPCFDHPTAHRIDEGWPVSITGSTHAPLKLIKTQLDGRYLLHGPCVCMCVLRVLFTCACLSRTLVPVGSWPHNPASHPPAVWIMWRNEKEEGGPRWLSFLSAGCVTSLALVNSWLKVEGCWHTLRPWYARMCSMFVCLGAHDGFVWPIRTRCMCLYVHACVHVCAYACAP